MDPYSKFAPEAEPYAPTSTIVEEDRHKVGQDFSFDAKSATLIGTSHAGAHKEPSIHKSAKAKSIDSKFHELEGVDPEERRRILNRIAQRKFRSKVRETKEKAERELHNQRHAGSSYQTPKAVSMDAASEASGLSWGGLNLAHWLTRGHEADLRGNHERGIYQDDDTWPYAKGHGIDYAHIGYFDTGDGDHYDPSCDNPYPEWNYNTSTAIVDKPDVAKLTLDEHHPESLEHCASIEDNPPAEATIMARPGLDKFTSKKEVALQGLPLRMEARKMSSLAGGNDCVATSQTLSDSIDSHSSTECYSESTEYSENEFGTNVEKTRHKVIRSMLDRVMEQFWRFYDQEWRLIPTDADEDAERSTAKAKSSSAKARANIGENSRRGQLKRYRGNGDDDEPFDNDNDGLRRVPGSTGGSASTLDKKFACPFRKRDPYTYSVHAHKICALSPWPSISRLKEHLYRAHKKPIHCKRCWTLFKSQQKLEEHMIIQAADICETVPGKTPDGITVEQVMQLRSRKKSTREQSDEDRWRDIYRLLFPDEQVPSPYYTPVDDQSGLSPDSRDLLEYESFLRREMPRLVRSTLEQEANSQIQPLEQALIESLPRIVQECQESAFRVYRQSRIQRSISQQAQETEAGESSISAPEDLGCAEHMPLTEHESQFPEFLNSAFQTPSVQADGGSSFSASECLQPWDKGEQVDSGYGSVCNCIGLCVCWWGPLFEIPER